MQYYTNDSFEEEITEADAIKQNHVRVYNREGQLFKMENIRKQTLVWRRYFPHNAAEYGEVQKDWINQPPPAALHIDYGLGKKDQLDVSRRDFYKEDGILKESIVYFEEGEDTYLDCYLDADNTITGGRTYHYDEEGELHYVLEYNKEGELYDGYDYSGEGAFHNWKHDDLPQHLNWSDYQAYIEPLRPDYKTIFLR